MLREDGKMMTVVIGTATTADVPVVWSADSATANVIMAAMAVIPVIATHTVGEIVP